MSPPKPIPPCAGAPAQPSLFDDLPPAAAAEPALALLAIPIPAATQTKAQRAFNRLVEQIGQQREALARWQLYEPRHHQRLAAELQPMQVRLREARRALLTLLDQLLSERDAKPRLSKAQRRKLGAWIPELAGTLLEEGPDAEIEAIFDRHSEVAHADQRQAELAEAEAMFGHLLGEDLIEGHQAQSLDELMLHAARRMAERDAAQQKAEAAQAQQAPPSPAAQPSARDRQAEAARQRQEDAAQQASQSVREVFRKLASLLHPDRETDAAERARKTALMQQANQAYQADDLLTLLTLQLQTEQIDGQHLAGLPDARLNHYNQVLREQLRVLQQELQACTQPYRAILGRTGRQLTPAAVDTALTQDIAVLQQGLQILAADTAGLRNPATRRAVIDELALPDRGGQRDEAPDAFELMRMMDAFASAAPVPGRRQQRR
jgi:hypothetical protein